MSHAADTAGQDERLPGGHSAPEEKTPAGRAKDAFAAGLRHLVEQAGLGFTDDDRGPAGTGTFYDSGPGCPARSLPSATCSTPAPTPRSPRPPPSSP